MAADQYCLKWNNHQSTLLVQFETLLESDSLTDCTLSAEGKYLNVHKVLLSACSPYFSKLLGEHKDKHPIFFMKDVAFEELKGIVEYMYKGEVNIMQERLDSFLKTASSLQIKGLADQDGGKGEDPESDPGGGRVKRKQAPDLRGGYGEQSPMPEEPRSPKRRRRPRPVSQDDSLPPQDQNHCDTTTSAPAYAQQQQQEVVMPTPLVPVKKTEPVDNSMMNLKTEIPDDVPQVDVQDLTLDDDEDFNNDDITQPGTSFSETSQDFAQWQQQMATQSGADESFMAATQGINQSGSQGKTKSKIKRKSHSLRSDSKSTNGNISSSGKKDYSRKPDRKHIDELKKNLNYQNIIKSNRINIKLRKVSDNSKTIDKSMNSGSRTKARIADLLKSSGDIPTLFNRLRTRKANQNNNKSTGILLRSDASKSGGSKLANTSKLSDASNLAGRKLADVSKSAADRKFKPSSSLKSKLNRIQGGDRNSDSTQAQIKETKKLDRKVQPFEFIDMSETGEKPDTESLDRDPFEIASSPEVDPLADVPGGASSEMEPSTTFPLFNFINPSSPPRFLKNITQEPEAEVVEIPASTNNAMDVEIIDEPTDEEIDSVDDDNDSDYKIDEDDDDCDEDGDSDNNLVIAEEEICALCHAPATYNHVCHTNTVEEVQESEDILIVDSSAPLPSSSTNMVVEKGQEAKTKQVKRRPSQDSRSRPSQDGKGLKPSKSQSVVDGEGVQAQNEDGTDEAHICMICSSEFRRQKDLLLHGLYKHGETSPLDGIQCNQCEHTTSTVGALYSHLNSVHFNQPKFKCHHCIYEASDLNLFHMHIVNNHQKMINKNKLRVGVNDDEK